MAKTLQEKIYEKLSYTNQDYNSILQELIAMFGENGISSAWNNISEADPLFILMSLMAAHKDILNYMIDYRILESFMSTARERASLVRIANSYGYKIPSYKAGRALVQLNSVQSDSVFPTDKFILYSFTQFRDEDNNPWVYIGPDMSTLDNTEEVEVYQGIAMEAEMQFSGVDPTSRTHIVTGQNIAIGNSYNNVGVSKLTVNGEVWTEVESLNIYTGEDVKVYELNVDPQGITYIKFHKNLNLNAYTGVSFNFNYIITQGSLVNSISDLSASIERLGTAYIGNFAIVDNSFYRGENPYTAQQIKEDFKKYYAFADTLVTVEDFKYWMENQKIEPGTTKCLAIDNQRCTSPFLSVPFTDAGTALPKGFVSVYKAIGSYPNIDLTHSGELGNALKDLCASSVYTNINQGEVGTVDAALQPIYIRIDGIGSNAGIQQLIADYINDKNFGDRVTTSEINNLLINSEYSNLLANGTNIALSLNNSTWDYSYVQLDYYQVPKVDLAYVTFI